MDRLGSAFMGAAVAAVPVVMPPNPGPERLDPGGGPPSDPPPKGPGPIGNRPEPGGGPPGPPPLEPMPGIMAVGALILPAVRSPDPPENSGPPLPPSRTIRITT